MAPTRTPGMARRSGPRTGSVSIRRNVSIALERAALGDREPAEDHPPEDDEHVQLQRDTDEFHVAEPSGRVGQS